MNKKFTRLDLTIGAMNKLTFPAAYDRLYHIPLIDVKKLVIECNRNPEKFENGLAIALAKISVDLPGLTLRQ